MEGEHLMPAAQTSYGLFRDEAFEGMIVSQVPRVVLTRNIESAAGIGFGKAAFRGAGDKGIIVPQAGGLFFGITVCDPLTISGDPANPDKFPQYDEVPVMISGEIWVNSSVSVADGDAVYIVPASGLITNVTASNIAATGWVFQTTRIGAGLVRIQRN